MPKTSTTVNFSSSEITESESESISLELDDDYHISLYGESKSEFSKTEIVYLKVKPPYSENPYAILTSAGSCVKHSQNNLETITEDLTFENTSGVELSDTPIGTVSTTWVAGSSAAVLISGKTITTTDKKIGILRCEYEIQFDRLQLTVSQNMTDSSVIVMVGYDDSYASLTVDYIETTTTLSDIVLIIKDIVSDEIIKDANVVVSLNGIQTYSGVTNSNGKVTIPDLIVGSTYDLKVTATNYLDSDVDYLNNDSFTVPST